MSLFERLVSQTEASQVRETVASDLMRLWPVLVVDGEEDGLTRCCQLVVRLLQDADTDVRQEMAKAVSTLLASQFIC